MRACWDGCWSVQRMSVYEGVFELSVHVLNPAHITLYVCVFGVCLVCVWRACVRQRVWVLRWLLRCGLKAEGRGDWLTGGSGNHSLQEGKTPGFQQTHRHTCTHTHTYIKEKASCTTLDPRHKYTQIDILTYPDTYTNTYAQTKSTHSFKYI